MQQTLVDLYEGASDAEMAAKNLCSVCAAGRPDYVRNVLASAAKPVTACTPRGLQMSIATADGIVTDERELKEEDYCAYDQNTWCMPGQILVDSGHSAVSHTEVRPFCFGDVYRGGSWWKVMC